MSTLSAPSTIANRQNTGNVPATSRQTDVGSKPTTPIQTTDGNKPTLPQTDEDDYMTPLYTMEFVYDYIEDVSVFAKMKIDEFQGVYKDGNGNQFLSVKCSVVKDYYDTLEDNVQFVLNIHLMLRRSISSEDNYIYFDEQAMVEFLSQFDYLFVYTSAPNIYHHYQDGTVEIERKMESEDVLFTYYYILPVSNGKLDLQSLRDFWIQCDADYADESRFSGTKFWAYVQDGLDESVFAEYIRENKERQMNRE